MNCPEPMDSLDQHSPNLTFPKMHLSPPALLNHLEQITAVRELHDKVQRLGVVINESLLVGDHIRVIDTRQDSDLIYRILFVLMILRTKFDLLQSIYLTVLYPFNLVNS